MGRSIADQWWGFEDGCKKMHWRSWEWLSSPKSLGGLGFQDFGLFNQAMLAKQCWRLVTCPDSLCARVLKGRYFPESDFLAAGKPRSCSFTWRSILHGRKLFVAGLRWGIGNGERVSIMGDNWILGFMKETIKPLFPIPLSAKVRYLMNEAGNRGRWIRFVLSSTRNWLMLFSRFLLADMGEKISFPGLWISMVNILYDRRTILLALRAFSHTAIRQGGVLVRIDHRRRRTGKLFGRLLRLVR
jgi:hypothetical protein